jgi:hypothetical protein
MITYICFKRVQALHHWSIRPYGADSSNGQLNMAENIDLKLGDHTLRQQLLYEYIVFAWVLYKVLSKAPVAAESKAKVYYDKPD